MERQTALTVVLEFAYLGVARNGGLCHVDREAGCAVCDSLTRMEGELDVLPEREWWSGVKVE